MPDKRLSLPETAVLLALMAEAREISNPELKDRFGFTLDGKERRNLNALHFVDSVRKGRSFSHVLTDRGWAWCADELEASGPPPRAGSAGGALYAILGNLRRYLVRADLTLADIFAQTDDLVPDEDIPVAQADVEARIRSAYRALAAEPKAWVGLADLRSSLADLARSDVDETLRRMYLLPEVNLVPESNQKALNARDRLAAVTIGNQEKHLLSIGS